MSVAFTTKTIIRYCYKDRISRLTFPEVLGKIRSYLGYDFPSNCHALAFNILKALKFLLEVNHNLSILNRTPHILLHNIWNLDKNLNNVM